MSIDTKKDKPDFVLETYIKTTASKLWEVLTQPEHVSKYHFAGVMPSGVKEAGEQVEYVLPDGNSMLGFKILEANPFSRLEMTFEPKWAPGLPVSRCVYELEELGETCKFTVLHFGITPEVHGVDQGWSMMAASIKSYIETGAPLEFPDDIMGE